MSETTNERAERCDRCRWWEPWFPPPCRNGQCRRNAPGQMSDSYRIWPLTLAEDWCGEFKAKQGEGS